MSIPVTIPQTFPEWTWITWFAVAIGWAVTCLWFDADPSGFQVRTHRWKRTGLVFGILFFLGTWQLGMAVVPYAMLALVAIVGLFLIQTGRLTQFVASLASGSDVQGLAGMVSWLRRWMQGMVTAPSTSAAQVMLYSKNGVAYGGGETRKLGAEGSEALVVVQDMLSRGIDVGATDIHLDPKSSQELHVRFRIDGMLQNVKVIAGAVGPAVISLLKVLGDMDIAERRRPQDGACAAVVNGKRFDIRAATGPTNFGEKLVLRLLEAEGGIMRGGLDALGMSPGLAQVLRGLMQRSQGMLIVCGPTGSGKTTSIYAAINEIDVLTRNIVTIEDPIEYRLDNISQTAVNTTAGLSFASILRSVLRQDPDVVLIGEVRDKETAEIAMKAALTGHLVLTTLHANDTVTTVSRLLDLGVEATLVQSTVTAVLAQRLIRLLCPGCKAPYRPADALLRANGLRPGKIETLYKAVGCAKCLGTGYRGRTGIYEFMPMDTGIKGLLVGKPSVEKLREAATRAGMRSLRQAALRLAADGTTSLEEAARLTT